MNNLSDALTAYLLSTTKTDGSKRLIDTYCMLAGNEKLVGSRARLDLAVRTIDNQIRQQVADWELLVARRAVVEPERIDI